MSFMDGIISLSKMSSTFIHVVTYCKNSCIFKAEQYSIAYIYFIFLIHLIVSEHLDCSHILAIGKRASVNMGVLNVSSRS